MDSLEDVILDLQAHRIAQTRMIRALIASHPSPEALRMAWAAFSIPSLTASAMDRIADPARARTLEAAERAIHEWTARLEQDLPPREPPKG